MSDNQERGEEKALGAESRHRWVLSGGAGGWEVWECVNCGRWEIPSPFGFMWSSLLGIFLRKYRCDVQRLVSVESSEVSE